MDTGKNKMVGMRKKRALRGTLFAVILSASMSFSSLAAMTADGPGMGTAAGASADTSDSTDSEQVLKTEAAPEDRWPASAGGNGGYPQSPLPGNSIH